MSSITQQVAVGVRVLAVVGAGCLSIGCARGTTSAPLQQEVEDSEPQWHFRVFADLPLSPAWTLTDVCGYTYTHTDPGTDREHIRTVVYATGWHGTILHYDESQRWQAMQTPTTAHLTAIARVDNGALFGLPAAEGEMLAVGWGGTVLHYHPNPDDNPDTADGRWTAVSTPEAPAFVPVLKVDPQCPDRDGDGTTDDGDGSGWWGDARCVGGSYQGCDDNCRSATNGNQRPLVDGAAPLGCLGPGDGPDSDQGNWQRDSDGDGVGDRCDDTPLEASAVRYLDSPLFDVWAMAEGERLTVVAVGGDGAVVTFQGRGAGAPFDPADPVPVVTDPAAWIAQTSLPFRYDDEAGRLPVSCAARCNPIRTACPCPADRGQCCDASASTGAGCGDGSCPPAANACNGGSGQCSILCPDCFRYLDTTLRAVTGSGDEVVAVGAQGTIVTASVSAPIGVWEAPTCPAPPKPLDERPLLAAVGAAGNDFVLAGAGGAVFRYDASGGRCPITSLPGAPPGFISGLAVRGGQRAYAVGDGGILLVVGAAQAAVDEAMSPGVTSSLTAVWAFPWEQGTDGLWLVGASGTIVRGLFY